MKSFSRFICALFVSAGSLALAADLPAKLEKPVKSVYPDDTVSVQYTRHVNGVTVHDLAIKTKDGANCTASITDDGDWIVIGYPRKAKPMPEAVKSVVSGLFKAEANDAQPFESTSYLATLVHEGKTYRATLNATGQLLDLASAGELKEEQSAKMQKDASYAKPINADQLPAAVRDTLKEVFAQAKVSDTRKVIQPFWRMEHRMGDEIFVLRVRDDGDILNVSNREALLPAHHTGTDNEPKKIEPAPAPAQDQSQKRPPAGTRKR